MVLNKNYTLRISADNTDIFEMGEEGICSSDSDWLSGLPREAHLIHILLSSSCVGVRQRDNYQNMEDT